MIKKLKKGTIGVVCDCVEVDVLDNPEASAPLICQLPCGEKTVIVSCPNKDWVEIRVSNSVTGFIPKKNFRVK